MRDHAACDIGNDIGCDCVRVGQAFCAGDARAVYEADRDPGFQPVLTGAQDRNYPEGTGDCCSLRVAIKGRAHGAELTAGRESQALPRRGKQNGPSVRINLIVLIGPMSVLFRHSRPYMLAAPLFHLH